MVTIVIGFWWATCLKPVEVLTGLEKSKHVKLWGTSPLASHCQALLLKVKKWNLWLMMSEANKFAACALRQNIWFRWADCETLICLFVGWLVVYLLVLVVFGVVVSCWLADFRLERCGLFMSWQPKSGHNLGQGFRLWGSMQFVIDLHRGPSLCLWHIIWKGL